MAINYHSTTPCSSVDRAQPCEGWCVGSTLTLEIGFGGQASIVPSTEGTKPSFGPLIQQDRCRSLTPNDPGSSPGRPTSSYSSNAYKEPRLLTGRCRSAHRLGVISPRISVERRSRFEREGRRFDSCRGDFLRDALVNLLALVFGVGRLRRRPIYTISAV